MGVGGGGQVVELLLSHKANVTAADAAGLTAFEATRLAGEGLCASVIWDRMGRPGGRLEVPPRPPTRSERDLAYLEELWAEYCRHRDEPFLPGCRRCDGPEAYLKALRRVRGLEDPARRPDDEFVVRKGVRVYLRDAPGLRARLLKDGRADG